MNIGTTNFPDITFIDNCTVDDVLNQMTEDYLDKLEELTGSRTALAQASPYRLIMEAASLQIYQAMQYCDYAGKMGFLTYSHGDYLDNLAALRGVSRKAAVAAKTTLQFSITAAMASAVPVPAGTQVTNGNGVFFATDEYAEIAVGQTSVTVGATCTVAGTAGTGFAVGEFTTMVTTVPYITAATNTVATHSGTDAETDDDLRERIYNAPGGYSTAGPYDAYVFRTKDYSSEIGDVYVTTEDEGEVDVYFLMADGTLPSAAVRTAVKNHLDDRTVRPLTDDVKTKAPTPSTYNITATYYISSSDTSSVTAIQSAVTAAVNAYNIWQTEKIGRDINPSQLIERMVAAGAKRVVVTSPTYTVVAANAVAQKGTVTVTYGGIEDD